MDAVERIMRVILPGGRVKRPDANTLVISDVSYWGDRQVDQIRRHCPSCNVRCVANERSLSGFVVIVERQMQGELTFWTTVYATVLATVAGGLYYMTAVLPDLMASVELNKHS